MKSYVELACDNLDLIQHEVYTFLVNDTELLTNGEKNWQFLDTKKLIINSPTLVKFFLDNRLYIQNASVTILYEDLPLHVDTLPMIAKINIPIRNTQGWVNRWYEYSDEDLAKLPRTPDKFGNDREDVSDLDINNLKILDEIYDMNKVVVFNSRILHEVINLTSTNLPRIVASFTFLNQPVGLLQ